jgi:hypothetical protein
MIYRNRWKHASKTENPHITRISSSAENGYSSKMKFSGSSFRYQMNDFEGLLPAFAIV